MYILIKEGSCPLSLYILNGFILWVMVSPWCHCTWLVCDNVWCEGLALFPGSDTKVASKVVILSAIKSNLENPVASGFIFRSRQFSDSKLELGSSENKPGNSKFPGKNHCFEEFFKFRSGPDQFISGSCTPLFRYEGVCDKDGCDFQNWRLGDRTFFGPGSQFKVRFLSSSYEELGCIKAPLCQSRQV